MIRIGIVGFGRVGKGVLLAIKNSSDLKCVGIFTRRKVEDVKICTEFPVFGIEELEKFVGEIDVLALCVGSSSDLLNLSVKCAKNFNTVDTFDNHTEMLSHYKDMDVTANENGRLCVVGAGWDPGLFSVSRCAFCGVMPDGETHTFWGKGVSQGHSEVLRNIIGVKNAVQYTLPNKRLVSKIKRGKKPYFDEKEKHVRLCYIVKEKDADKKKIVKEVKSFPHYFKGYKIKIKFLSDKAFKKFDKTNHGGCVFRLGNTSEKKAEMEFKLNLESNAEFTGSVITAYIRALHRLFKEGKRGALTPLDIPPSYFYNEKKEDLIKKFL